jgi:diguanylate cyclase (GGDEF)-like protein
MSKIVKEAGFTPLSGRIHHFFRSGHLGSRRRAKVAVGWLDEVGDLGGVAADEERVVTWIARIGRLADRARASLTGRAEVTPETGGVAARDAGATRDPVLLGLAGLCVAAVLVYGTPLGPGLGLDALPAQAWAVWLGMLGLHVALVRFAWQVTRAAAATGRRHRVWTAITLMGAFFVAGDVAQVVALATMPISPALAMGVAIQNRLMICGTVTLVGVLVIEPLRFTVPRDRLRFWLDAATVMAAVGTVCVYAFAPFPGELEARVVVRLLAGPWIFMVGVFGVVKLILGPNRPFSSRAGLALGLAALVEAGLGTALPLWRAPGRLPWLFGLTLVANALLTASARLQQRDAGRRGRTSRGHRRPFSLLPYTAVAATNMLLVGVLAKDGLVGSAWIVIGGAIVSSGLVVARQVVALVDSDRLLVDLDETVRELRRALHERDRLADRLRHLAFHDPLTGLANRALFTELLQAGLSEASDAHPLALLLVDLDAFKPVNDRFGHAAGDRALVLAGERLRACVPEPDLVARLGGDEFALIVRGSPARAREVAETVVAELSRPFRHGPSLLVVGASVGIAFVPAVPGGPGDDGTGTVDDLLHRADLSLYRAKAAGGNGYRLDVPTDRSL